MRPTCLQQKKEGTSQRQDEKEERCVGVIVRFGESANMIVSQNAQQALMKQDGRKRNKIASFGKQQSLWLWLDLWGCFLTQRLQSNDETGGRKEEKKRAKRKSS